MHGTYVHMHIYVFCIHIHVYMNTCIPAGTYILHNTFICTPAHTCTLHTHVHTFTLHTHAHLHTCTHCTHACCTHMHICTHMCTAYRYTLLYTNYTSIHTPSTDCPCLTMCVIYIMHGPESWRYLEALYRWAWEGQVTHPECHCWWNGRDGLSQGQSLPGNTEDLPGSGVGSGSP